MNDKQGEFLADATSCGISSCCGAPVYESGFCKACKEHCDTVSHQLTIHSLRDSRASCICGWSFTAMTSDSESDDKLRLDILQAFRQHLYDHIGTYDLRQSVGQLGEPLIES